MNAQPGHLHLLSLIDRFEGSDVDLAAIFDVNRTTIWRLKSGKISKISKYIEILEKQIGSADADPLDRILDDLLAWSKHSAEVRAVLTSLHIALRDYATPSPLGD